VDESQNPILSQNGATRVGHPQIFGMVVKMGSSLIDGLFVFMLAGFIGFEVIKRISPLLHTPLMSITNALDAIAVVGAIVLVGRHESRLSFILGILAVIAATSNIVGGFLITDRMLRMFKSSRPAKS
jgi:NAD(P) transhydrogenase subunit alpha